jgi:hypothetical protein
MEGDAETLKVTSAGSAGRWRGAVRRGWWTCVMRDAGEGGGDAREAGERGEGAEGVRCRLGVSRRTGRARVVGATRRRRRLCGGARTDELRPLR